MGDGEMIYKEVKGLYKIIPFIQFRRTKGVSFEIVPKGLISRINGIDRVVHEPGAISPGSVEGVESPWYMHPFQEDYLLVLDGVRYTELYTPAHGAIETFEVSADAIKQDGQIIFDGPAILAWPCYVFHRVKNDADHGSAAINLAVRHKDFNIKTNFNIYDVDTQKGISRVIREGSLDQFLDQF